MVYGSRGITRVHYLGLCFVGKGNLLLRTEGVDCHRQFFKICPVQILFWISSLSASMASISLPHCRKRMPVSTSGHKPGIFQFFSNYYYYHYGHFYTKTRRFCTKFCKYEHVQSGKFLLFFGYNFYPKIKCIWLFFCFIVLRLTCHNKCFPKWIEWFESRFLKEKKIIHFMVPTILEKLWNNFSSRLSSGRDLEFPLVWRVKCWVI
jgi:hypothetical protein